MGSNTINQMVISSKDPWKSTVSGTLKRVTTKFAGYEFNTDYELPIDENNCTRDGVYCIKLAFKPPISKNNGEDTSSNSSTYNIKIVTRTGDYQYIGSVTVNKALAVKKESVAWYFYEESIKDRNESYGFALKQSDGSFIFYPTFGKTIADNTEDNDDITESIVWTSYTCDTLDEIIDYIRNNAPALDEESLEVTPAYQELVREIMPDESSISNKTIEKSFVFSPLMYTKNCSIVVEKVKDTQDFKNASIASNSEQEISITDSYNTVELKEFFEIKNFLNEVDSNGDPIGYVQRLGVWSRPNAKIIVNNELIRIGAAGYYEIAPSTVNIQFFGVIPELSDSYLVTYQKGDELLDEEYNGTVFPPHDNTGGSGGSSDVTGGGTGSIIDTDDGIYWIEES